MVKGNNEFIGVRPPAVSADLQEQRVTTPGQNVTSGRDNPNIGHQTSSEAGSPAFDQNRKGSAPGTDASAIVGAPGKAPLGKIYEKTGERVSEEEYRRRKDEDEALIGYDRQIAAMEEAARAIRPETPEQREKRERREKSKRMIAATVDGLSALSNLFFTTQYAPNAYNPQSSQLGKVNERIEALKAERQADADRYTNLMLRLGDAQNAKAKTLRDMRAQAEAQRLARQKAEDEAKQAAFERSLWPDKAEEQKGKTRKAKAEGEKSEKELAYVDKIEQGKIALNNAKIATEGTKQTANKASAANSYASAAAHNRSNPNEFSAWDENDNPRSFSKKDAADYFAKQHGTWQEEDIKSSTKTDRDDDVNGHTDQTVTTTKKGGYPARPKPKDNTPPSRRGNNNDNTPPSRRK